MSYQPGNADLPAILQNSTYDLVLRMTETFKAVNVNNPNSTFRSSCHGFEAGERIVFLNPNASADYSVIAEGSSQTFTQSCRPEFNRLYYVSSEELSHDVFKVSETLGGAPIEIGGTADANTYLVARPLNITGFTMDADICQPTVESRIQISTFTCTLIEPGQGTFRMSLTPQQTSLLSPGTYAYDLSVTPPNGSRFYAMRGSISVELTRSR